MLLAAADRREQNCWKPTEHSELEQQLNNWLHRCECVLVTPDTMPCWLCSHKWVEIYWKPSKFELNWNLRSFISNKIALWHLWVKVRRHSSTFCEPSSVYHSLLVCVSQKKVPTQGWGGISWNTILCHLFKPILHCLVFINYELVQHFVQIFMVLRGWISKYSEKRFAEVSTTLAWEMWVKCLLRITKAEWNCNSICFWLPRSSEDGFKSVQRSIKHSV